MNRGIVSAFVLSLTSYVLWAEGGYTNLAGNVISATPVKVVGTHVLMRPQSRGNETGRCGNDCGPMGTSVPTENGVVSFGRGRSPSGPLRAIPLNAFPASEQKRIREAVGGREVPGELKGLAAEIAAQRARVEARAKAGRMTAEALAEYRHGLAVSWDHAVEEANLNQEEKNYWKGKCP